MEDPYANLLGLCDDPRSAGQWIYLSNWRVGSLTTCVRLLAVLGVVRFIHYSERNMYARDLIRRTFKMAQLIIEEYVGLEHA